MKVSQHHQHSTPSTAFPSGVQNLAYSTVNHSGEVRDLQKLYDESKNVTRRFIVVLDLQKTPKGTQPRNGG